MTIVEKGNKLLNVELTKEEFELILTWAQIVDDEFGWNEEEKNLVEKLRRLLK